MLALSPTKSRLAALPLPYENLESVHIEIHGRKDSTATARPEALRAIDETQPGLLIRAQPSGAKAFYLVYRNATNVRRRMRTGGMEISVFQARRKAKMLAAEATLGKDHVEERRLANAER